MHERTLPWEQNKPINRKHINIFLTALVGQSSQGRTPTRPRNKRDKIAILLWNSTEKGRFVPGTGPILSRGAVPFVPGTVPVCPGDRPAENIYVYWFFSCPTPPKNLPFTLPHAHTKSLQRSKADQQSSGTPKKIAFNETLPQEAFFHKVSNFLNFGLFTLCRSMSVNL